jgi:predicted patatin/cPLA2 family phospholipase
MRRISHDLPGVTSRINRLTQNLIVQSEETQEYWKDKKSQEFMQRHLSDVGPCVSQVVTAMQKSCELFENIAKQLRDPDAP